MIRVAEEQHMPCNHDAGEQDTAAHFDGLCPLCLQAENARLREIVEAAKRWRRAYYHGTREEFDIQEQCLADAIADEQTAK
jgi:hypothetical protein